jgi:hypothetical protein
LAASKAHLRRELNPPVLEPETQPSISHIDALMGKINAGKKLKGGIASAPHAPAAIAMHRRFEPDESVKA